MALSDVLQAWGFVGKTRTRETTRVGKKYGVMSNVNGVVTVRAPSGADALQIAGTDNRTQAGTNYTVANHKGGGVYEIKIESGNGE